jgi:hypothetical protein
MCIRDSSSSPSKITSTSNKFRINLASDYYTNYNSVQGVVGDVSFVNATKTFTFQITQNNGSIDQLCLQINKIGLNGQSILNLTCTTPGSPIISYEITENVTGNKYIGIGYVVIGDNKFTIDDAEANFNEGYKTFGNQGLFYTFLLALTLVMVGVWSPIIATVLLIIALIAAIALKLLYLGTVAFVSLIIMGGIVIYRLNK